VAIHVGIFSLVTYSGTQAKAQSGSVVQNSRISVRHVTAATPTAIQHTANPVTKPTVVAKNLRPAPLKTLTRKTSQPRPVKGVTAMSHTDRATISVHTARPASQPAAQSTRVVAAPRAQATSQPLPTARQKLAVDPYYPARYRGTPTQPPYPRLAVRLGQEGTTRLVVEINPQGEVVAISLHKSSGFAVLDKAAIAAVQEWKFIPPTGVTGTSKALVPVRFKLS
jgi:protein TonB